MFIKSHQCPLHHRGCRGILAWIVLAALFIALSPLILFIAVVALFFGWARTVLLFIPLVCNVICHLQGLEINIEKKDSTIFLSFK